MYTFSPRPALRLLAAMSLLLLAMSYMPHRAAAAPPTLALEFNGGDAGIADTGFTTVLPGTNPADTGKLTPAGGALQISTTSGDLTAGAGPQDNALAIQYSSSGSYTIQARLRPPIPFAASFQSGGIYIAKSSSSYIRFTAGVGSKRSSAERLQLDVMDNGKLRSSTVTLPARTFARIQSSLDLFITVDQTNNKINALYRIDSVDDLAIRLATTRNLPRWMPKGNNSIALYAGLVSTNRGAAPVDVSFDWFRLTLPVVTAVTGTKSVDKDGISSLVSPGDTLTYTINVTNNGPTTTVYILDPIPVDTSFQGSLTTTPGNLPVASFDSANSRVAWSGTLGGGQSVTISFQ